MPVPYQKHGRRHAPTGEDPIPGLGASASGPWIELELSAPQTITSGTAGETITWTRTSGGEGDTSVWVDQWATSGSILNSTGGTGDDDTWYTPTLISGQQAVWLVSLEVQWEDPTVSCVLRSWVVTSGSLGGHTTHLVYDGVASLAGVALTQTVASVSRDAYNPVSVNGKASQNTGGDLDVTAANMIIYALPPIG